MIKKPTLALSILIALFCLTSATIADENENENGAKAVSPNQVGPNITDPNIINIAPPDSGIFISRDIAFYEAHWQGMDVMELGAELRQKLNYPTSLKGIIVGEVTLNAALSGMLGGDVIIAVQGKRVTTLRGFRRETREVQTRNDAALTVLRKTSAKNGDRYVMNRMTFILRARNPLGFAQVESAPMILAGDQAPHPERGPCTKCHSIGAGQFNMPDPDLITLPPPDITQLQLNRGVSPHQDRGPCLACHQIKAAI